MAFKIGFKSDKSKSQEEAEGSDNRLNVSSRQDSRRYYISRDESDAYTVVWDDASSSAGDFIIYLKNTHVGGKEMVVSAIGLNSELACSFKLHLVTGAASGTAVTPFNLNRVKTKAAAATCVEAAGTPIANISSTAVIDHASCTADGHEEFRLDDTLRLGQEDAIAIEFEQGSDARTWGVIFFYFEG